MIISDVTSNKLTKKSLLIVFSIIVVAAILLLITTFTKQKPVTLGAYYCDMEITEGDYFVSSNTYFKRSETQSNIYSRSGKYSCFLKKSKESQFGVEYKLTDFKAGETYKASVWRYREKGGDDGHLIVSASGDGQFYKGTTDIIKSVGGWELLEIIFKIPVYKKIDTVNIYVYSLGNYPLYFDDLLIQKISEAKQIASKSWTPQTIQLNIDDKSFQKLSKKRDKAFQNGILESSDDDWVKTKITRTGNEPDIKASLRLKGDWLDHLKNDKWSFRIKTKEGESFNRLRYFSLHTPEARSFLNEWVLHELFKQEEVLTTHYDFLVVELNNNSLGVYAIEEHFDKVLLERQQRREGPIIRFSEDGYWAGVKRLLSQVNFVDHDIRLSSKKLNSSPIRPFREKKVLADASMKEQFEQALLLLEQYKEGNIPVSEIFDLDKTAKYFAICEAMSAYHGITWHNQRFYFNPVTSKLEPIGFDGYAEKAIRKNYTLAEGAFNPKKIVQENLENFLFFDLEFTELYIKYIQKYTSRSFLNEFFANIEEELKAREALINTEFENYKFKTDQLIVNAQRLNATILPFDDHVVKAYTQEKSKSAKMLRVANFHGLPIELIGYGETQTMMTDTLASSIILEAFHDRLFHSRRQIKDTSAINITNSDIWNTFQKQETVSYKALSVEPDAHYLFFRLLGIDSVFHSEISDWKLTEGLTIQQSIFKDIVLSSNDIYKISDGMVFFKEGKHQISKPIIIPAGYRVIFQAGCQLDFVDNAFLISKSPVFMNGTADAPILINSSDKSAQGFTILQAGQESKLHYVDFNQLNTLTKKGWTLTGAVTFYESDVVIDHCVFKNNLCEDALNIIRSNFNLEKSLISNTFGDGLDADFCKGEIKKVSFINTGNDGMDFSGSVILVHEATIDQAGDKGISVGEDTDASIVNVTIKNSNIATAAKDLSTLVIENIQLENCNQGFTAFQKKPEFGGANIIINKYAAKTVKRLYNIREGSTLQLENKMIFGEKLRR